MQMTRLGWWWSVAIGFAVGGQAATARAQDCTSDAECAPPLACKPGASSCSSSGGMSMDGGMTVDEPVCETGPAVCTWVLVGCQTEASCTQPSWTCMALDGAVPATSICFPRGIDCTAGAACPAGWGCVDFSTVKEKDLAEMWASPGSTRFCWPDVLRGVPDKTTPVDSTQLHLTGVSGGGLEAPVRVVSDAGSAPAPNAQQGSGCSMSGRGASAGTWLLLVLVVAWRLGRKLLPGLHG
jgi:hypothetical protein